MCSTVCAAQHTCHPRELPRASPCWTHIISHAYLFTSILLALHFIITPLQPYGYQAGCNFALGKYGSALGESAAAPYLCKASEEGKAMCLHDASGAGECSTWSTWDGFYAPFAVRITGSDVL